MFRNDINVHDYNRQLQNSDVKEFNLGYSRERRLMSSWRLHMSDVENEKSEGLAYTMVFKGKHTFQKTYTLNLPGGLEFGPRAVSGSVYRGPEVYQLTSWSRSSANSISIALQSALPISAVDH